MYYLAKGAAEDRRSGPSGSIGSRTARSKSLSRGGSKSFSFSQLCAGRSQRKRSTRDSSPDRKLLKQMLVELAADKGKDITRSSISSGSPPQLTRVPSQAGRVKQRAEAVRQGRAKVNLGLLFGALLLSSGVTVSTIGFLDENKHPDRRKGLQIIGLILLVAGILATLSSAIYHSYLVLTLKREQKKCREEVVRI